MMNTMHTVILYLTRTALVSENSAASQMKRPTRVRSTLKAGLTTKETGGFSDG